MSYARARSKLANLLIKAGYNKAKSLRAVEYPYVEGMQLTYSSNIESVFTPTNHKFYENKNNTYTEVKYSSPPNSGISATTFVRLDDKDYGILGEKNKVKAYSEVTQDRIDLDGYIITDPIWISSPLDVMVKYKNTYPRKEITDSFKKIGEFEIGFTTVAGIFGIKEDTIPLPEGGWLKIES